MSAARVYTSIIVFSHGDSAVSAWEVVKRWHTAEPTACHAYASGVAVRWAHVVVGAMGAAMVVARL